MKAVGQNSNIGTSSVSTGVKTNVEGEACGASGQITKEKQDNSSVDALFHVTLGVDDVRLGAGLVHVVHFLLLCPGFA